MTAMTPAEHYARADELLASLREVDAKFTENDRVALAMDARYAAMQTYTLGLAQAHATLALYRSEG